MQPKPTSANNDLRRGGPHSTIDLLELFWRRRAYLIASMLLTSILGVVYYRLATPMYESSADVLVVQKRPQAITGDHQYESGFEDYLATHLAVIVSPLIVERAIESSNLAALPSFADLEYPEEELVDTIIENLEVEGGSRDLGENADSIMTLAFRCREPDDAPIVVQALLDSYEGFHDEVYRGMTDTTVNLIRQASDLLTNDLAQQEESYSEFRQTSPLVARGTEEVNPLQDRLTSIEVQRSELLLRKAEIEWQLLAIEQAKQDGGDAQQLLSMITELRQQVTTDNGTPAVSTALENQLIQLLDDERALLEHYGPNHPHVQTIRQRIADTRRLFALPTTAHMSAPETSVALTTSAPQRDPVAVYTEYLKQELKRLEISEGLLTVLYDHEHDAAKEHSIFQLKDERFQRNIQRTEALYDVVISRLQEASLIKDFGGFETRVIAPPMYGMKVSPRLKIILPAAALAGILLGCMLAFVVELRDDNFQSCEQIQQQMGVPVVGQIPQFTAARTSRGALAARNVTLAPMLCSFHQPRSMPAESFRTLRTALYFNGQEGTSRVTQITGATAKDGASTVAANLAISLAQTGKRVLLIDADLHQQEQIKLFGIAQPETGLAAIVASDVEPSDAICPTAVENLWLLPAGLLPNGPCELFTSPRFGELINLVRDSYDHVLIDTEPLLVASDPSVIASHADGVLLALGLAHDSRLRAMRAKQMLERIDVNILGVVANRLSGALLTRHQMKRQEDSRSRQARSDSRAVQTVG